MKTRIKTILSCCAIAIASTVTAIGLTGSRVRHDNLRCKDIDITITDSASNMFTTRESIERMLNVEFGSYRNRYVDSVNLYKLESVVKKHKYIDECHAYFTSDGMLHLTVSQCTPVIKLAADSTKWYLDCKGTCIPTANDWSSGLLRVAGSPRIQDSEWTGRVAAMAVWIDGRPEWKEMVEAVRCASDGQLSLTLHGRNESFDIGQPVRIKEKFARIDKYLKNIATDSCCREYKTVNVKYRGQIVCK